LVINVFTSSVSIVIGIVLSFIFVLIGNYLLQYILYQIAESR
jgi:hypothetical protein